MRNFLKKNKWETYDLMFTNIDYRFYFEQIH